MSLNADPNLGDSSEDDEDYVPSDDVEEEDEIEFDEVEDELVGTSKEEAKPVKKSVPLKRISVSQAAEILTNKKKKVSVLDKTNSDWNAFVKKEGIQEDLKHHNRSKDAYIEKQEFLLKADYCEFEKEKALRNLERKK